MEDLQIPDFPIIGGPYDGGIFMGNPECYGEHHLWELGDAYYEYEGILGSLMFRGFKNEDS